MMEIIIMAVAYIIVAVILITLDHFLNTNDLKKQEYLDHLPGFNCGSCGYGSCEGMAEAMCKDKDAYKKCRPLRGEKLKEMEKFLEEE